MKKFDLSDLGLPYKRPKSIHVIFELKKEDLVLEAQINFPYENFPNMPAERKRPRSTLIFRDLNKFWRKKKKTEITCSNTNKNPNIHNPLKSTTDPYNIYSAKQEKWYISKLQTSHQWKIQFKLRNSKKPTKTEHGSQYIGGSDSVEVQSYKLDIVMVAAVSNAIGASLGHL